MTSRSSSSKGLVRDGVRRSLWAVVLSTLAFFMSMLLPSLMEMQHALENRRDMIASGALSFNVEQNWQWSLASVADRLGGENVLVKIAVFVLAVVVGTAMFAYLHDRRKVDFYHSLPVSREKLYAVNYATGAVCVLVPYLVMRALTMVCAHAMGFGAALGLKTLLGVIVSDIIFFLLLFAMSALATIVCGNTIIALLLQLWVFFAPVTVQMLREGLLSLFCKTYGGDMGNVFNNLRLSPAVQYFMVSGTKYSSGMADEFQLAGQSTLGLLLVYAAAVAFFIVLGMFAFRVRKSERAGTALAFRGLCLPVKVFMCLVMGFVSALGFRVIGGEFWMWPGLVFGVIIFHAIVEIIYAFDFRALVKHPVQLVVILAVAAAILVGAQNDVLGFDRWLPDESKVTGVKLDADRYDMSSAEPLNEAGNIEAACRLAQLGRETTLDPSLGDTTLDQSHLLTFYMKNGSVQRRRYTMKDDAEVDGLLSSMYGSSEYKAKTRTLFRVDIDDCSSISLRVTTNQLSENTDNSRLLMDTEKSREIIETLRKECLTYTELSAPVMMLNIESDAATNTYGCAFVTERDVQTLALIRKYIGVEPTSIDPENIGELQLDFYVGGEENVWVGVEVTDRNDIAALVKNAISESEMQLYSDITAQYGLTERADNNVRVYASRKAGNENALDDLVYPKAAFPTETVEKYRAAAEKLAQDPTSNAVTLDGDTMVTRTSLG